jgi:hypothetical protein
MAPLGGGIGICRLPGPSLGLLDPTAHLKDALSAFSESTVARVNARLSKSEPGPASCRSCSIFLFMGPHFSHIRMPADFTR